jgi:hypothetical protein
MNLSQVFDYTIARASEFITQRDDLELDLDRFHDVITGVLNEYNNYRPRVVLAENVLPPADLQSPLVFTGSDVPEWVASVRPSPRPTTGGFSAFSLLFPGYRGRSFIRTRPIIAWRYVKPNLIVDFGGEIDIEQVLYHKMFGLELAASVVVGPGNTGDGTLGDITFDPHVVRQEWTLTAIDADTFSLVGSIDGELTDDVPIDELFDGIVKFTITNGVTAFVAGDKFRFDNLVLDDYSLPTLDYVKDRILFDLIHGMFLKVVGRARNAFTHRELPIVSDSLAMIQTGKELYEKAQKDLRDNAMIRLAWG